MAKLIYSAIASLDGYVEDKDGKFDWAAPGEEVHAFVNDLERPIGTYLYGRRMYETMAAWETMQTDTPVAQDFASIWRAANKIGYSTTLHAPTTGHPRRERDRDLAAAALAERHIPRQPQRTNARGRRRRPSAAAPQTKPYRDEARWIPRCW